MAGVIDHVGIRARDLDASRRVYAAALSELEFELLSDGTFEGDRHVLFGRAGNDDFCLHSVGSKPGRDTVTTGAHVAFIADSPDAVDRWHEAAVREGAVSIGEPGHRPEYSGYYYAAYVLDPDGNNVEVVFNAPSAPA